MHPKFTWWSFSLLLLLLESNNNEILAHKVEKGLSHSHMDHSLLVFFTPNDLKIGKSMPIYFRASDSSLSPRFLPKEEADLIHFSTSKLPLLLDLFGVTQSSSQAKAMEDTLRQCETNPIKGETKLCATSLEAMLEFVRLMLTSEFRGLSTREMTKLPSDLRNYTIIDEPEEILAKRMVACHTMPYPYAVFYCHYQESESKVFQVKLTEHSRSDLTENKLAVSVEAIAVCHMNTSQWSRNHASFRVLGIEPGSSPVCHFFPADNLVWVPLVNEEGYEEI